MPMIKLKGKFKWAQHLTNPQEPFNNSDPSKPKAPTWNVAFYPDKEALEVIRDLQGEGLKNVIKKDEDGYCTRFSRPVWREIKGKKEAMSPPVVTGADPTKIGNGSEGIITLDVYEHNTPGGKTKAKAARLFGVEITTLVEYTGGSRQVEPATERLF